MVLVTVSVPVVVDGVVQFTVNEVLPVPPAGTFTPVCGFAPLTVQLLATVSFTLWLPAASPVKVVLKLGAIVWLTAPGVPGSTVTV